MHVGEPRMVSTFLRGQERADGDHSCAQPLVVYVGCGIRHTAAVTADGELYTFGHNMCGQLGHGVPSDWRCVMMVLVDTAAGLECTM